MSSAPGPVLVVGAGAVGCYLGGTLAAAGAQVHFVGRSHVLGELRVHGMALTDLDGHRCTIEAARLHLSEATPAGLAPSLVLLCVKSPATRAAAADLQPVLAPGTVVVCMQNGVTNAETAQQAAPDLTVLAGMVPFNIAQVGPAHWHRGTSGVLAAQDHPLLRRWQPSFEAAGLALTLHRDLGAVSWGKLLLNLNNPVNALSGLALSAQLMDRGYRRITASLQREALAALRSAGIRPARVGAAPPTLLPHILNLPTPLFKRVAARMLRIDEHARSSMADDLARGRPTEIDALCGEVVRLASRHGRQAPMNRAMLELLNGPGRHRFEHAHELMRALKG